MNELSRHIEILLLSNDCVVVPGLGGFVAHHVDARYDDGDGLFLPPLRTLGFNPQLTMNDSLLVQSYMESYDMSYPEALRRIQHDVEELRETLSNNGSYELTDIGKLYVTDEGKTAFTPCEAGILTPLLYGLSSFDIAPIKTRKLAKEKAAASHADVSASKARIIAITDDSHTGQKMLSISINALRNTAVAAVVVALFFFVASPLSNNPTLLQASHVKSSISFDAIENMANSLKPAKELYKKATAKSPSQKKQIQRKTITPSAPTSYWALVLCSRVSESNAQWFAQELKKEGIATEVTCNNAGSAKVLYGRFATKDEAQNTLHAMQGNKHFKQAWALEVNNSDKQ